MSFSSVCEKCSALRFSWVAIWESWREREVCRDAWVGLVVEVGGLRERRVLVLVLVPAGASAVVFDMGERPVVFDGDVGTGEGEEGGRGDGGREGGEKGVMEERSGASCSGGNLGVGMDGRSGAGRLVGGCVRCPFRGQQRKRGGKRGKT